MECRRTEIVQVRDVPSQDVDALRAKAEAKRLSLSGYLREVIHRDAARPNVSDVIARIETRISIDADTDDIRSFIDEGRM